MSRVLLVLPDASRGVELSAALTAAGLEACLVASGERAMDRFIQEPADVVVLDFHLEGRDGVSTANAIRWMPGGRRARVILTASREPDEGELESLAQQLEPFATIVGPVETTRLVTVVVRAAAVRPHEEETRLLSPEQAIQQATNARALAPTRASAEPDSEQGWQDTTVPQEDALSALTEPLPEDAPPLADLDDQTLDEPEPAAWEWSDADGRAEGREVRAIAEARGEKAPSTESPSTESRSTERAGAENLGRAPGEEPRGAIAGSFEAIPFARLLHRMAETRASGALICEHPPDERDTTEGTEPTKVVYFRAGVPVHVRSNLVRECLGQVLARRRTIGRADLESSLSAVWRGEGRQGELLIKMGAIGPLELSVGLAEQLRVKLFELFSWQRGTFRFVADRPAPPELIDLELGLADIVYLGVRQAMSAERALSLLEPHRDRYVVPQPRKMVRFVGLSRDAALSHVMERIDGETRLDALLDSAQSPGVAAQLVYAMECLDAVRFEPSPPRRRATPAVTQRSSEDDVHDVDDVHDLAVAPAPDATEAASARVVEETLDAGDREPGRRDDRPNPDAHPAQHAQDAPEAQSAPAAGSPFEAEGPPDEGDPASGASGLAASRRPAAGPPEPHESSADVAAAIEPLDDRVQRLLRAERHFRRGQRALDRARYAEAVEAFGRATELCPDEGPFLSHLAWARHGVAPDDAFVLSGSLEMAHRAVDRAPDLAVGHLLRARLLLAAGHAEAAALAYARALELAPDDEEAKRGVL